MNLIKQKELTRDIRENWQVIESLESNLLEKGNEWIREMALQGQRLIHLKTQLKHGDWLPWCEANSPDDYNRINRCMKIASRWNTTPELSAAASLRHALELCQEKSKENSDDAPKRWPAAIEANLKLSKFVGYVERFPVQLWAVEQQDKAREQLEPVARQLWPMRFE